MTRDTFSLIAVIGAVIIVLAQAFSVLYGWVKPEPYKPLEALPVILINDNVAQGQPLPVRDGICNNTDKEAIDITLYAYIQSTEEGPLGEAIVLNRFDLVGTSDRYVAVTLFRCLGTEPTALRIPADAPPGLYTLTVIAQTLSETGKPFRASRTSPTFEVTNSGGN